MPVDESKITTFITVLSILLREVRQERGIHQAQIADIAEKTPSAWTKVETGRSPLALDVFLRVCNALNVPYSSIMGTAERYAALLTQNEGWGVVTTPMEYKQDALMNLAQEYWGSPGFRHRQNPTWVFHSNSVLNGPIYNADGTITIAPVFQFALDPEFRAQQLAG